MRLRTQGGEREGGCNWNPLADHAAADAIRTFANFRWSTTELLLSPPLFFHLTPIRFPGRCHRRRPLPLPFPSSYNRPTTHTGHQRAYRHLSSTVFITPLWLSSTRPSPSSYIGRQHIQVVQAHRRRRCHPLPLPIQLLLADDSLKLLTSP